VAEVEIIDMREYPRMIRPGFMETMLRVTYRTEKGYTGVVEIPKAIATKEKIQEEIKKAASEAWGMVGSKFEV